MSTESRSRADRAVGAPADVASGARSRRRAAHGQRGAGPLRPGTRRGSRPESVPSDAPERRPVAPLSRAPQDAAAVRTIVWAVVAVALAVELVVPPGEATRTGWAAPLLAMVIGYGWSAGLSPGAAFARLWRGMARPYLLWLGLLGVPALLWESVRDGAAAGPLLGRLAWGGLALGPPLAGHWLLGGLIVALALMHAGERWLAVDPVWLLPAALALTYGAPLFVGLPLAVGVGAMLLTWVLLGRVLRLGRGRLARRRWHPPAAGAVLALGGAAATFGLVGPVAPRQGLTGAAILGPVAAGALGAGLILLAEAVLAALPVGTRRALAAAAPLGMVALATVGVGSYLAPSSWPPAARAAAALTGVVACSAAVAALPHATWLTGAGAELAGAGRHSRRRDRWARLRTVLFPGSETTPDQPPRP